MAAKANPGTADRDFEGLLRPAEVLGKAKITHQVLYRYVTLGLIEPAAELESGARLFHPNVIVLIEVIQSLIRSGYSLRDIKEIYFKDERVKKALASQ
ncbi:MAG: MerR family transcriptional regulator [Planctomycetes bacterium]|nr:MerR family transcriptional regulator [Planctomycetota bacterium]